MRFLRWPNLVLITLLFLMLDTWVLEQMRRALGISAALSQFEFSLLITDVLIVTVVGYWWNDIHDRAIDLRNRPDRLLVQRPEFESKVRLWTWLLVCTGFSITVYLAFQSDKLPWILLFPVVLILLHGYAKWGKRWGWAGNALVSALIAILPVLILVAETDMLSAFEAEFPGRFRSMSMLLVGFMTLMFLANMAREVVKDVEDAGGDRMAGAKSVVLNHGLTPTKALLTGLVALIAVVQWTIFLMMAISLIFFTYCTFVTILAAIIAMIVIKARNSGDFKVISRWLKSLMFAGLLELMFIPLIT